MAEELIQVISYFGNGECYKCRHPLNVLESETNNILLSKNGVPVSFNNEFHSIKGYCTNCGSIYEMEKVGLHYTYKGYTIDNMYDLNDDKPENNPFMKESK